ncbi:MAG: TSUP family transporter [Bacteroidia bacterium]|jgi:hypothetical protein|nr:TSUP family transporter [Bacteroidia bacterium]
MDYLLISIVSLLASGLTFFSGFGLGTILLPVFALFFPLELAITLTAIVHLLNNLFKLLLTYPHGNKKVVLYFGLPALISAILGAFVLNTLTELPALHSYELMDHRYEISPVKLVIAVLLLFFSLMELLPRFKKIQFDQNYLPLGGLLSGFFGGLSGNQGALRSAFLLRAGLSKESFIASGVKIACLIDVSRLTVYSGHFPDFNDTRLLNMLLCAVLSAFFGALLGNQLIKKITLNSLQLLVTVFLIVFSVLLAFGIL